MNTMQVMVGLVCLGAIAGCAHTDPVKSPPVSAEVTHVAWPTTRQGVITIDELRPRSDIVILPPSIENVVWVRGIEAHRFDGKEVLGQDGPARYAVPAPAQMAPARRRGHEEWPLLADEMDFDSEIGRVRMCLTDGVIDPCENPERYRCYGSKAGGYCVER